MTTVLTVLVAILIFALLIFVHEFGHFITAKLMGIRVLEFAIGMGPKLFSWGKKETTYSLRLIPIGGYCAMEGEDQNSSDPRAINNKPAYKRLIVLASGAFMNILLGFVLLIVMTAQGTHVVTNRIGEVQVGTAAEASGLLAGDEIVRIQGSRTPIGAEVMWSVQRRGAEETEFLVRRDGQEKIRKIRRLP